MAAGVLKTFGVDPAGLSKAKEAWKNVPAACWGDVKLPAVTMGNYQALVDVATKQGKPVNALLDEAYAKAVEMLINGKN